MALVRPWYFANCWPENSCSHFDHSFSVIPWRYQTTYVKATMKGSKKCKSPFAHLELSTVIRIYAMFDITRCLLLVGPMILLFFACKNVSPQESELEADNKYKEGTKKMMLYKSNPRDLSDTEYTMLANVEKTCGHDYINNFPTIWASGGETLGKVSTSLLCNFHTFYNKTTIKDRFSHPLQILLYTS